MNIHGNQKKCLLIIDRDEESRREFRSLLSDEYDIIELRSAREGIFFLEEWGAVFCAALLGVSDAREDLLSFFDIMRDKLEFSAIPILIRIDASTSEEMLAQLGQNAVDCIELPIRAAVLKNRIANAMQFKDSVTLYGIEKMLKELPSNIYLKDREGRYIFATHYWHHLDHGDDPNWTIRGKTDVEIRKDRENAIEAMKSDQALIDSGQGTQYTIEINSDGVQEFFEIIKRPLFKDGNVDGIIALVNNVTEHELLKKQLEVKARTDELTGVYNRTYFYEYLRALPEKSAYPVSIISTDCDDLKIINDTYGHMSGDTYIQMAVRLFQTTLPKDAAVFRVGGDEFTLLLPSTTSEDAAALIGEMKDAQKKYHVRDRQLSISFGLSTLNSPEDSVEMCIAASDQDMYKAKRQKHRR